jgi:hypothetical protein
VEGLLSASEADFIAGSIGSTGFYLEYSSFLPADSDEFGLNKGNCERKSL